jgi:polyvinyl alcohol dehydrogenase (cytochrome)
MIAPWNSSRWNSKMRFPLVAILCTFATTYALVDEAEAQDGAAAFAANCATCHITGVAQGQPIPGVDALRALTPEAILNSLLNGRMRIQGTPLTAAEQRAVAEFLGGRPLKELRAGSSVVPCTKSPAFDGAGAPHEWNGWGNGIENTRYAPNGGLTAADLPRLELKWAFGFADVTSAKAQPALVGNRLFVASDTGEVHALDPETGCAYWSFLAEATVRTGLLVAPYDLPAAGAGWAVFFGDLRANAYAVDATTGALIWSRQVDEHALAAVTGTMSYHDGRVYVPVQGLNEEVQGGRPEYECCTFRGSVSSLDASSGKVLWKTYTIADLQSRGKNSAGTPLWGPAGGGVWSAPTIDAKRGALYVSTGNGYADPAQPMTDAVIALDLKSGEVRWSYQALANDNWTLGCGPTNQGNPNCPATLGPDLDFSASPALTTVGGRDLLVLPQKSGVAYALDPDNKGKPVWQRRFGPGNGAGGQWGGAVDGRHFYVGATNSRQATAPAVVALDLATGQPVWERPPEPLLCDATARACKASHGAAVTAIPGAVLSGSLDGGLRAYAADDGALLWQFDTNREFETVNGVEARGGSMDAAGPTVAGGLLIVNSGYGGIFSVPGNALLVFGVKK